MTINNSIDSLLEPFQHFGVNLGLTRIKKLLADLDNPQQQVPIIHVAGTNGKGSVCAYLSSILTAAGYRVGRYISPHLVDWTERICLNEQPIASEALISVLQEIKAKIDPNSESPTQFEVITAAAWLYFAQSQVDLAVMEVGLGGRLDATNVCDRPLVSVITSISKEHWQRLGPTVADIAGEKAGILKQDCPAVIGILPPEAQTVVQQRIKTLNCPAVWIEPATETKPGWAKYQDIQYPLPLLGQVQLINSAIAVATCQILQQQGWQIPQTAIVEGMKKTRWLGRLQWTTWQNRSLLIDGAHNPAAAIVLRQYVDTLNQPVIWIMGILSTKDHEDILQALLRPQDELHLVPVPDHSTAEPQELATLAQKICPQLKQCQTYSDLFIALQTVWDNTSDSKRLVILCGSLYLLGYFLQYSR
ncbi:FolC bifunctional protein [Stanieria cyanosphaera PCC 7437]|uniref:tetrahydrofolate synthase n=1 Tax=Stanieria cyanosphaera (strain ATCC 29371 / PCC 7437) TaxID=111780 RepID=K9XS70_STAC7|nr:folylpolyglutamate synthase/dihydrofolate synthase family protein [Stanieria cyanosphaera]AFZ34906.1 FolC bifunctional protein [Stanieria cyanosphaera PCC 7437]